MAATGAHLIKYTAKRWAHVRLQLRHYCTATRNQVLTSVCLPLTSEHVQPVGKSYLLSVRILDILTAFSCTCYDVRLSNVIGHFPEPFACRSMDCEMVFKGNYNFLVR